MLREAGAEDADMLIAVTGSDEVNMVACQVSYSMFRTPRKIARVRSAAYVNEKSLFADEHMPVDVFINPEQVVTDHVRLLLENPGALQVLDFAEGRVQLVAVRAYAGSPLVGQGTARRAQAAAQRQHPGGGHLPRHGAHPADRVHLH